MPRSSEREPLLWIFNGSQGTQIRKLTPCERILVDPAKVDWLLLPRLTLVAVRLYNDAQKLKGSQGAARAAAQRRAPGFRQTNPW